MWVDTVTASNSQHNIPQQWAAGYSLTSLVCACLFVVPGLLGACVVRITFYNN